MSTHEHGPKSAAQVAAQRYYNEGLAQTDQVLIGRLGLIVEQLPRTPNSNLNKAAAFWFASQKMYLKAQQFLKSSDQIQLSQAYVKGALDLAQRSRRLIESEAIDAPVLSKISSLIQKCKSEPNNDALAMTDIQEDHSEVLSEHKISEHTISEQALIKNLTQFNELPNTFADDLALKQFLKSRQSIVKSKLKFLPDDKLVNILGFEAQEGFLLDAEHQQLLQRVVNLQTLFSSVDKITGLETLTVAFDLLETELKRMIKVDLKLAPGFLKDGFFVTINLLYLRVLEKCHSNLESEGAQFYPEGAERAFSICAACCRLGFAKDSSQKGIVLHQASRAYFIGQALLLSVQYDLDIIPMLIESMIECTIDYPVIVALPSGFRLLLSMPSSEAIAQVALDQKIANQIVARLPFFLLEMFEVPQDREALKLLQLKELHERLVTESALEIANITVLMLLSTLCELGHDWPEMYPTIAKIKSVFRRKNLKLNWHDESPPYWTLKLRTEPGNPWQNDPFPNEDQIRKLLKRFDF